MINLLPWREKERKINKVILITTGTICISVIIIIITTWSIMLISRIKIIKRQNLQLEYKIAQLKNKNQGLQELILAGEKTKLVLKQSQILATENLKTIYILEAISASVPNEMILTKFSKKIKKITIQGYTKSLNEFEQFLQKIAKIKYLKNIKLQQIQNNNFSLICNQN